MAWLYKVTVLDLLPRIKHSIPPPPPPPNMSIKKLTIFPCKFSLSLLNFINRMKYER